LNPLLSSSPEGLEVWLSAVQVAELLGVTRSRVGQLRREQQIPAERTPLGYLYHRDDVDCLLLARIRHPSSNSYLS
jgi:hypothetical protein